MNADQLHAVLRSAEWTSHFDDRTLARGADYARRHRVTALQFTASDNHDTCTLQGTIRGSAKLPYQCHIEIHVHGAWLTLESCCSCPVGNRCKHAVASLLVAAHQSTATWPRDREKPAPTASSGRTRTTRQVTSNPPASLPESSGQGMRAWAQWLGQFAAPTEPVVAPDTPRREFGLLLRGTAQDHLQVQLAWMRPSKNARSGLVDPKPLTLHESAGPLPAPEAGWPDGVAAALAILLHRPQDTWGDPSWGAIHTSYHESALETLLAHYPVYFERGSAPLARGPDRPLQLRWNSHPDGSQQLAIAFDDDEEPLLLRGDGLWYILRSQRLFGRIEGATALIDNLRNAPAVLPEQVDAVRESLRDQASTLAIPLPAPRGPVEIVQTAPTPVLHLRAVTLSRTYSRAMPPLGALGCARLSFDYADQLLAPQPDTYPANTRMMENGRVLELVRDWDAEEFFEQELQRLHLHDAIFYNSLHGIRGAGMGEHDFVLLPKRHQPALAPGDWHTTLTSLELAGFRLVFDESFEHTELVEVDGWHGEVESSGQQWFDVRLGVDIGDTRIDLLPVLRRLIADPTFPRHPVEGERKNATWQVPLDDKRRAKLPLRRLRALIEPLLEWLEDDGDLRLHRSQSRALIALDDHLQWRGADLLRTHADALTQHDRSTDAPAGFGATLRPYQREGLAWLDFLGKVGLGGVLADDMGLGKTVQVLAHLLGEKQRGRLEHPALVVAPTSLVGNWQAESERFAKALSVLVIHGADRADRYDAIASHDLVITTYPLLPRDRDQLLEQRFSLLVLDEAQAIKNPRSHAARVVREIPATRRLAMTGTPLENHLGELWAQFDVVEPGLLGSQRQFTRLYRTPIEKHGDVDRQQRLNRRIGPLLLRRRKEDVLTDLPAKTQIVHLLELEGDQRALYETLRLAQHARVQQAVQERGLAQSGIIVLDALLKLRQACCDPRLVKLASARKIRSSAKLTALLELLDGLLAEDRRILLFSQFTEMLGLIETELVKRGIVHQVLTGQTPASTRSTLVKRFQGGEVPVFLISLKAGGVGLNLTAADTVIHYDPWWNPAAEAQATDRAHRIGQEKPVFVYRLICAGTVEEKIQVMQNRKAELARAVLEGGGATTQLRFDENDLAQLFAPL